MSLANRNGCEKAVKITEHQAVIVDSVGEKSVEHRQIVVIRNGIVEQHSQPRQRG
jgi:hypothetical protein